MTAFFRSKVSFFVVLVCVVFVYVTFFHTPRFLVYAYEDAVFALDADTARAVVIGNRYFDATSPTVYDIERAERFYRAAEERDPLFPSVQHQLARIAFLRSDFPEALAHIDREIAAHGTRNPNAYYIRALILGYQSDYMKAAADYEEYFKLAPANWAGINDYAWVLLKADLPEMALAALEWGLNEWPGNPWLLHNYVIALYELGRYEEAAAAARAAVAAADNVSEEAWLHAYPGNDPRSAPQGLASFRKAVRANQMMAAVALLRE